MVSVRRVPTCTGETIYRFELPAGRDDAVLDCLSTFGAVERPVPGLFKLDESGFVVTGNLGSGEFDLRVKAGAAAPDDDPGTLREAFERALVNRFETDS